MKKKLVGILKTIIVSVSLYFLFSIFRNNINNINLTIGYFGSFLLFALSILYAFLLTFVAWVWKAIVENLSKKKYSTKIVLIYLKTFIAKYVPGNFFHYVTRQAEMSKEGISHKVLVKGNMVEAFCLILSSIFLILILAIVDKALLSIQIEEYLDKMHLNIILCIVFLFILIVKELNYMVYILYYCFFFIGLGLTTYCVANSVLQYDISFYFCIFIFTVSWLVGTLSPGAPGGIGVRESMFIVLSNNILMTYEALLLAVLLRLVTIGGELICYLSAIYKIRDRSYAES